MNVDLSPAFEALAREIQRFPAYQDPDRMLIVFAEVSARDDGPYETLLRAFAAPPPTIFGDLPGFRNDMFPAIMNCLKHPRKLDLAHVRHFTGLPSNEPLRAILFDALKTPQPDVPTLRDAFDYQGETGELRGLSQRRRPALRDQKESVWTSWKADLLGRGPIDPKAVDVRKRNDLDDLLWMYPDLLALTLPVLGSPVVVCYLAVSEKGYEDVPRMLSNVYRAWLRELRDVVMPHLFVRFAQLATHHATIASRNDDPRERSARFLIDAAGILLAKSIAIPGIDAGHLYTPGTVLASFKDGMPLEVAIPRGWASGAAATIVLPAYKVIDPDAWPAEGADIRTVDTIYSDGLSWNEPQRGALKTLLSTLVGFVYDAAKAKSILARAETAFKELGDTRQKISEGLREVEALLPTARPTRLRAVVDQLAEVMNRPLLQVSVPGLSLPARESPKHLLREHFDRVWGKNADAESLAQRNLMVNYLVTEATKSSHVLLDVEEMALVTGLVDLLLRTYLMRSAADATPTSVLAWAARQGLLSGEKRFQTDVDVLNQIMADYEPNKGALCVTTNRARMTLATVNFGAEVPTLALILCLGLVGAWFDGKVQNVQVTGRGAGAEDIVLGVVTSPDIDRGSQQGREIMRRFDAAGYPDPRQLNLGRFADCVALMCNFYDLREKGTERRPSGFTLTLGAR